MKLFSTIAALALVGFTALPAQAQNATAGSASQANNSVSQVSVSASVAQGGTVVLPQPLARQTIEQTGTAELRTAPSLGGLALGGGHPCAYAPATFQVSVIGGGAGGGGMKVDTACMLLIMASAASDPQAYAAATYMMAGRDRDGCRAMAQAGMVADCVDSNGNSYLSTNTTTARAKAPKPQVAFIKCERNGNTVTFKRKNGFDSAVAKSQCMASLGF